MPTLNEAFDDLLVMFKTAFDSGHPSVVVKYPNKGGDVTDTSLDWVRISFPRMGEGMHSGIGSGTGRYEKDGLFTCQIFTVKGKGTASSHAMAQTIVDAYEGKTSTNGVICRRTQVRHIGSSGGWYQTNVTIFFEFDEYK